MRTILIITRQAHFSEAIEATLEPGRFRLIQKEDAAAALPLLTRGAMDVIVMDIETGGTLATRAIGEVCAAAPGCPLIVYSGERSPEWEEEIYLLGVSHLLDRPVRGKLLSNLLDRLVPGKGEQLAIAPAQSIVPVPPPAPLVPIPQSRGLESLRRFSSLLVHSLDARQLMRDALQQLREALGVNRAAIFLRKPSALNTDGAPSQDDPWLRPAHAIGHEPGLINDLPLSLAAGIGQHLYKHGRILRADHPEALASREIKREFSALGSEIALPLHDRELLLGVLVLDGRITGGGFGDEELSRLFHWLEELAVALRNCWRHEQLGATHGLIDDILAGIGTACVVIGASCGVLHSNSAALRLIAPGRKVGTRIDFADIPQTIGSLIFQVLQTGEPVRSFKWEPPGLPGVFCRVGIQPFIVGETERPNAALLVLDDITEHERAAQLELEAGKLRLVRAMAWHLAHEIGNALTPISTMQQLLELQGDDPEVRSELSGVLGDSVRRVTRLTQQMNFLSRDWDGKSGETIHIAELIENAYADARSMCPQKKATGLVLDKAQIPWTVSGDRKALKHAFSELILNALQANPENPIVTVRVTEATGDGKSRINVEVQDSGPGFPAEVAGTIGEPFTSTRSVGLGLGLTVTRKIIENHRGVIEIPVADGPPGIIRVSLPAAEDGSN